MTKEQKNAIAEEKAQGKKVHTMGNTPFRAYGDDENGYTLLIGDCIVSEKNFPTIEAVEKELKKKDWSLISITVMVLVEKYIQMMSETKEKAEKLAKK